MVINIHAGHTSQNGKSAGASGIVHESVENRKIKDAVIKILRTRGNTVYDCTSEGTSSADNLRSIVSKCNSHAVDVDVSIHLNCYNGKAHGTETLITSSRARTIATRINSNIVALGYTNRGVKIRNDLYFLNRTKAPAILIETFFCDSREDVSRYRKQGINAMALAIADGICPVRKAKIVKATLARIIRPKKKTIHALAVEVIQGKWGNGSIRKRKLLKAGYNYAAVQREVNRILK